MKKNITDIYPLSFAQQGMLYDTLKAPESGIHIEQFACTITGNLDVAMFREAWQRVINQYAALRTGFVWETETEPVQIVFQYVDCILLLQDWRGLSQDEQAERLHAYLRMDRHQPFKLTTPPLIRFALFQTGENVYEFVCTYHHILMDGWCTAILMKDFVRYYQALSHHREIQSPAERPYKEYIRWQRKQDMVAARVFWQQHLQGFMKPTMLGREGEPRQDRALLTRESHDVRVLEVSADLSRRLTSHVRQQDVTLNTLFQGVWALILSRYSGTDDVLFGITVSGRPAELSNVESMVGLFINTLPMRVQVTAQEGLWSWLERIQLHNAKLRQYEYTSGSDIYQCSEVPANLLLYESLLVVENYPANALVSQVGNLDNQLSNARVIGAQTQYALTLLVTLGTQISLRCIYDTRRFTSQAVEQILEHFHLLFEHIMVHQVPLLDELRTLIAAEHIPYVSSARLVLASEQQTAYRAPRNVEEEIIAGIYAQVFGLSRIGIDDSFVELGGHSLLATQIATRVRAQFSIELPLRTLFDAPVIWQLAERVSALLATKEGRPVHPAIVPVTREKALPASFSQQRLWFLARMNPSTFAYNTPLMAHLTGKLHVAALHKSLEVIIERHEVLRTTFTEVHGEPVQVVAASNHLAFSIIDVQALAGAKQERESSNLMQKVLQRPFDLSKEPPLRVIVLRLSAEKHLFVMVIHHIAFDDWSSGVFIHEFTRLYEAFSKEQEIELPALLLQYADYAVWQRQWLQGKVLNELIAYWKEQLSRAPSLLLPVDRPELDYSHFHGTTASFMFPPELAQQIATLSRREGVTTFMTLLAAFQVLLYRYTGQEDSVLGTDIANRLHVETEMLIGFFVNLLVLRTNLSGQPSFVEVLQRVREMVLQAYAHQDLPFDLLVNELHLERNANQVPLVKALFVLQNAPQATMHLPDLEIEVLSAELTSAKFDLAVFIVNTDEGLKGNINYRTGLFEARTIHRLIGHFQVLLQSIVEQPGAQIQTLEMFSEEEKHQQEQRETAQFETGLRKLKLAKRRQGGNVKAIQQVDFGDDYES